jgi:hypothetical protein
LKCGVIADLNALSWFDFWSISLGDDPVFQAQRAGSVNTARRIYFAERPMDRMLVARR